MPRPTDRNASKDRKQDERRPQRKASMGMYIPVLLAAVIVCGIGLAILTDKNKPAEKPVAASEPKRDPFADVPAETPPPRNAGGGSSKYTFVSKAPEGLAENATWKTAQKIAAEGETLFEQAAQAKAAGDMATLNEVGREAREKLTSAVEMTAVWEEELLEKYGDGNASVREIKATRSRWIDKMRWLHKSSAL